MISSKESGVASDIKVPEACSKARSCLWYLKLDRDRAVGYTEVQGLDVFSLPDVHPGVVGHRREASWDLRIGS